MMPVELVLLAKTLSNVFELTNGSKVCERWKQRPPSYAIKFDLSLPLLTSSIVDHGCPEEPREQSYHLQQGTSTVVECLYGEIVEKVVRGPREVLSQTRGNLGGLGGQLSEERRQTGRQSDNKEDLNEKESEVVSLDAQLTVISSWYTSVLYQDSKQDRN